MAEGSLGRIFLCYRREETRHVAGRLADRLAERLGSRQIFVDVDSIEPGVDFTEAIMQAVSSCDVLLALIGRQWATVVDEHGRRRLDDPDDFVVLEIKVALERGVRIIPVLVDGAVMPRRSDLPARPRRAHPASRRPAGPRDVPLGRHPSPGDPGECPGRPGGIIPGRGSKSRRGRTDAFGARR